MHVIMLATGSMTFVATVSSRLNIFMPPILIQDRDPWDSEHMVLRINSGSITVRHADVRRIRNRSCMNAIDTSASDIVDVSAATMRSRKKSDDHNCVRGICANTYGRVTKTSVAPSSPSLLSPNDFTAGNIIIPIITATSISRRDTVTAVRVRRVSLGK